MRRRLAGALAALILWYIAVTMTNCHTCRQLWTWPLRVAFERLRQRLRRVAVETYEPLCPFCAQPTCFRCRDSMRHAVLCFPSTDFYAFGFCLVCGRQQALDHKLLVKGSPVEYRCRACDGDWTPTAIVSVSKPGEYICPFCGALQRSDRYEFYCGRCAMPIKVPETRTAPSAGFGLPR